MGSQSVAAVAWGVVLIVLSAMAWGGQLVSWLFPQKAARLGLKERDEDVDPLYAMDIRGEAAWDSFTLWTLLAAGVLLTVGHDAWAYFGLVGGGIYLYFAGRGVVTRRLMRAQGFRVGATKTVQTAYIMLAVWGGAAAVTLAAAAVAVSGS